MIIINTTAPMLVDATALHDSNFLQKNTALCSFSQKLSADYSLAFDNKNFEQSPNTIDALRTYMQNIILQGIFLDPQTLLMHVDRVLSLPPQMFQPLIAEIDNAFAQANNRRKFDSLSFIGKLANLLNQNAGSAANSQCCGPPCNYFKDVGDACALLARFTQQNTNNVAPAWDGGCSSIPAPLYTSSCTCTKITPTALQLLTSMSTIAKKVRSTALNPLLGNNFIQKDAALIAQGKCIGFTSHGGCLATDPYPYFQTQNNASKLLAQARAYLRDCFRSYEYKYRYNPLDPQMNRAVATNATIQVASEKCIYKLNVFGKPKVPVSKPPQYSVKEFLDRKESIYDWDDAENRTLYPITGYKSKEPNQNIA